MGTHKAKTAFSRLPSATLAVLFVISLAITVVSPYSVSADSPITKTYDTDTELSTGTQNQTAVEGSGAGAYTALCHGGPECGQYYREITIDNTEGGTTMHSPLVHITVDTAALITAGKMQSDCGDIRFTDSDQTTELLNGHVENCNSTTTDIQLVLPVVDAETIKTIYMYYGALHTAEPLHGGRVNLDNTMVTNPSPPAELVGDATWDGTNHYVQLTEDAGSQSGALEYHNNPGNNFDFSTEFYSGDGSGADSIYLYMGASSTPTTENDDVGGYIFIYDEYQDYIGVQYGGYALAVAYCGSIRGLQLDATNADKVVSSAACNLDNSVWRTARVVRTDDNIKMYLDGSLIIDFTSGSLPDANGPLMGWGARTGGSTNNHRIRNLTLDIGEGNEVAADRVSVGSEASAADNLASNGSWTSPVIDMVEIAKFGSEDGSADALAGSVTIPAEGDYVKIQLRQAYSEEDLESATVYDLLTLTESGTFSITGDDLNDSYNPDGRGSVIQLIAVLHREGESSPQLDSISLDYLSHYYGVPSAPLNLQVENVGRRTVNLSWEAPTNDHHSAIYSYIIDYKLASENWGHNIDSIWTGSTDLTYNNIALTRLGEDYTLRIQAYNDYGEGEWSAEVAYSTPDPTVQHITDCEELQAINDDSTLWGDHFVLDNDIDCSDTVNWNEGAGFTPIAEGTEFYGSLDGQGHSIKDLYINNAAPIPTGLFGATQYAQFSNLRFDGGSITSDDSYAGALMGYAYGQLAIDNVTSNVPISATDYTGGLVGYFNGDHTISITGSSTSGDIDGGEGCNAGGIAGIISDDWLIVIHDTHSSGAVTVGCSAGGLVGDLEGQVDIDTVYATGNITTTYDYDAGGLIGYFNADSDTDSTITNAYATGNVTSAYGYVGGLFGEFLGQDAATLQKSYATGNVASVGNGSSVGGLIGYASNFTLTDVYATGAVTGDTDGVGGLIGYTSGSDSVLTNAYASGDVSGGTSTGGLTGYYMSRLSNVFATGHVTTSGDPAKTAGLVGEAFSCANSPVCTDGAFEPVNTYYDSEWSYIPDTTNLPGCTAVTQANYFVNKSTGSLFGEWDFVNTWVKHANALPTFAADPDSNEPTPDNQHNDSTSSGGKKRTPATTTSSVSAEDANTAGDVYILLNDFDDYTGTHEGHTVNLTVGQVVHFTKDGELHSATVKEIGNDYVILTVASTPFDVTVPLLQTLYIDVDKDGTDDISVRLNSIDNGVADLTFKQLVHKSAATPQTPADKKTTNWWWLLALLPALVIIFWATRRKSRQDD